MDVGGIKFLPGDHDQFADQSLTQKKMVLVLAVVSLREHRTTRTTSNPNPALHQETS
jgi:hypothetical protein